MAIRRADFEYYVAFNEIIISGVVNKNLEMLDIPSHINRFPVVSIEREVFRNMPNLTTVYLPETMEAIGNYAFADCPKLKSVKCTSTCLMVSGGAFMNCSNLVHFQTEKELHLQTLAFEGCTNLRTIDAEVASFAKNTFAGCKTLSTIVLARELSRFHGEAFNGCDSLNKLMFLGNLGDVLDSMEYGNLHRFEFVCGTNSNVAELATLGYRVGIRDYL